MTHIHILRTPMEEIRREPWHDGTPRFCFVCRARYPFELVVCAPIVEPPKPGEEDTYEFPTSAYYGPSAEVQCTNCHTIDGDCFPGTYREWE